MIRRLPTGPTYDQLTIAYLHGGDLQRWDDRRVLELRNECASRGRQTVMYCAAGDGVVPVPLLLGTPVARVAYPLSLLWSLEPFLDVRHSTAMSSVKEIESALTLLPLEDLQAVRDWLDDLIEEQLEVSDEFKAKILRAKREIADGVYSRTRKPDTAE